ncbi:MAG: hypothetical protein KF819_33220 [Labilithrix sp.]|nr:hypothetical protein [Labilithrix sp.]
MIRLDDLDDDESLERALFARRAERPELAPPAEIGLAVEARIAREAKAPARGVLARLARRGHLSAACVAALFLCAAWVNREPRASVATAIAPAPGVTIAEPLACAAPLASPLHGYSACATSATEAEPLMSSSPIAVREILSCGAPASHDAIAICEP